MNICSLTYEGVPVTMRAVDDFHSAKIPFEPSCFGGAAGDCKGCLSSVPQASADAFISLEEWATPQLSAQIPNIKAIWVSSIRPSGKWPPTPRSKINIGGSNHGQRLQLRQRAMQCPSILETAASACKHCHSRCPCTKSLCRHAIGHHASAICR